MAIIYDQFGRPYPRPEKKPARRPLAAAPLTDAFRDYVADGLTPARLAALFKEADAGNPARQAELFDQVEERDGHIIGEISKRRNVILDADFTLVPASEDPRDVRVCEDVERMLEEITDWPDVLVTLQESVGKGFACLDMAWDTSEGQARVERFEFIEQRRFLFTDRAGVLSKIPRLVTDDDPMGVDIPAWRVMMHRYGGKTGHAARMAIYRVCAWWYLFKNYSVKDWVIFCEVYGMPLRLGKYTPGASEDDKQALEIAVRTLGTDAAGIISQATEIEFVTGSSGAVSTELYKDLAGFANKEMSKAILGGTLTADVDGKGSYAAASTHNDVRLDLVNADARALASTIRDQLIRPYVGFNYGWDTPIPKYTGRLRKEDLAAHAELIDKFADRMDIPVSHVREKFGIPEPEKGEACLMPKIGRLSASMEKPVLSVAADAKRDRNEDLDFSGRVAEQLGEQSGPMIDNWLDQVKEIMAMCGSLEEIRERLVEAFPGMETRDLGELMADAMAVGHLGGRYEVKRLETGAPMEVDRA